MHKSSSNYQNTKLGKMDRVILGFSNVYRYYKGGKHGNATYTLEPTTNNEKLSGNLAKHAHHGKPLVIAMIENAISDEIKNAETEQEREDLGKDAIDEFFDIIKRFKKDNP